MDTVLKRELVRGEGRTRRIFAQRRGEAEGLCLPQVSRAVRSLRGKRRLVETGGSDARRAASRPGLFGRGHVRQPLNLEPGLPSAPVSCAQRVDRRPQRAVVGIPLARGALQQLARIDPRRLRLVSRIGQVIGARRPDQPRAIARIVLLGGFGQACHRAQQRVEVRPRRALRRGGGGTFPLPAQPVEPGKVRQQQPRVIAPPHRDQLAVKEHRLLHPFQRAFGQHRLGMAPRQPQRRAPPLRKQRVPPPREVQAGPRDPHPRRRHPHVPMARKLIQKPRLARRGEHGIIRPAQSAAKPLPVGGVADGALRQRLGWGNGTKIPLIPASFQPPLPHPPLKGR